MNNMDNLQSYDNVEYLQAHKFTDKELYEYFILKMNSAHSNVEFIKNEIILEGGSQLNVCEIGGGNGKLLFCLEKDGFLKRGVNYEVSKNRCDLAKKFAAISSSQVVETRNCNFLEDTAEEAEYDCIVMVDIVLQIISPLYDLAEHDTIQWVKKALKKGGCLFIEFEDYSDMIRDIEKKGEVCTWQEFPAGDPFQYMLSKFSIDRDNNLVCEKTFIGRDNNKTDHFKNVIRPYTQKELTEMLERNGFSIKVYSCSDELLTADEKNNVYRILAKKL